MSTPRVTLTLRDEGVSVSLAFALDRAASAPSFAAPEDSGACAPAPARQHSQDLLMAAAAEAPGLLEVWRRTRSIVLASQTGLLAEEVAKLRNGTLPRTEAA